MASSPGSSRRRRAQVRSAVTQLPPASARNGWKAWALAALIVLLALFLHSGSLNAPFVFDDHSLPGDPAIGRADGWVDILANPARTRPLTYLTFWINERLQGFHPWAFHATNLLVFGLLLGVTALLYRRLLPPVAAVAALVVFALHPLQTEAVAYVFARSGLLAALFTALAWLAWTAERRWQAVGCFVLAMLAKEEAAAFPVFLAGYEVFWRKRSLRGLLAPLGAMVAAVALFAARLFYAIEKTPGAGAGSEAGDLTPWSYLLTQGRAVWLYLRLLIAPYGQNFDRDWQASTSLDLATATAWTALLALVGLGLWFVRRWPEIYWWLGGLLLLTPTSSVLPLADLTAERRMLLPMLSFSLGVGLLLQRLPRRATAAAVLALAVTLGALTVRRTNVWRTEETLWRDAAAKSPNKVRPKLQLARALESGGAVRLDERRSLIDEARRLEPTNPLPLAELGVFELQLNDPAQALKAFEQALELSPEDSQIRANIGSSLWLLGRRVEAVEAFRTALALDPCNFDARNNLMLAMRTVGMIEQLHKLAQAPPGCRFSAAQREALEGVEPAGAVVP
ncbi:MAG: tetratricopeptide repeat protein [Acidobacteria bacterium]|nr:tetratricopeptide repeat protein [Acidobacteriota bacterium]